MTGVQSRGESQILNEHIYHVEYRTRRSIRVGLIFVAGLICAMPSLPSRNSPIDLLFGKTLMVLLAIWGWERTGRSVTLSDTGIELAGWFSKRSLRREEIRGYRIESLGRAGGGNFYVIVPLKGRRMTLPLHLEMDDYSHSWMHEFPKLKS